MLTHVSLIPMDFSMLSPAGYPDQAHEAGLIMSFYR